MTDDEAAELGPLVKNVSLAVQAVAGCDKTYVVQFAEHRDHPHVHVHVIPRAPDLPEEHQGPRIFALLGVTEREAVPDRRMDEIADSISRELRI
jgi:diadenosine tetraphosphate (Ap4A) HIT family hydrolase